MKTKNHRIFSLTAAALAATLLSALPAQAMDWSGYFRAGPAAASKGQSRASSCYGLKGTEGLKYRLGNECDIYGEFLMSQDFKKDGVEWKANFMANMYRPGTDTPDYKQVGVNQLYLEAKGFSFAPEASVWAGKRFYGRDGVHIVDTNFTNLSGVGAGIDNIKLGAAQLNLAFFRNDNNSFDAAGVVTDDQHPGNRFNVDLHDIAVNPGGTLRFTGSLVNADFKGGKSGVGLSVEHKQDNAFGLGGANLLFVQYAQGTAALNGGFGDLKTDSGTRGFRIVESMNWQVGPFGGQAIAMWTQNRDGLTRLKTNSSTVGGRLSYAITPQIKLLAEIGYSQIKPDGAPTQKLAKLTLGPALSTGPGLFDRPELRLYVTNAKWNAAANAAAGPAGLTGAGDGKTNGTSFGAQVEVWF